MNADEALELKLELSFKFNPSGKKVPKAQSWFKNKKYLEGVIDSLAELPFFKDLKLGGPDEKLKPFKDAEALKALVATGREEWTRIRTSDETRSDLEVLFQPSDEELDITIRCARAILEKYTASIIDQYIRATTAIRETLGDSFGLFKGYVAPAYRISGKFQYPRPRPPRKHPGVPMHSVVDFVDLRFHTSKHADAEPDEAKALATSRPPAPTKRSEKEDFVILQWAKSAEEPELQRAASARAVWFAAQLPTELETGFNEQGDRIEDRGKAEAKPPLTLYSPKRRIGYKAVVVFPDGSIEPHAWNQAKMVLKNRATEDGTPVDEVKIVVPLRELVFTVADEARKAGFAAVLYPASDGVFWNPDPPGMWLTPPHGSEEAKPLKPREKKSRSRPKS